MGLLMASHWSLELRRSQCMERVHPVVALNLIEFAINSYYLGKANIGRALYSLAVQIPKEEEKHFVANLRGIFTKKGR